MNKYDLQNRLRKFGLDVMRMSKRFPEDTISKVLSYQLIKSCTSPALNYAEALSAESNKDFIHKLKICTKELRETLVNLAFVEGMCLIKDKELLNRLKDENNQLIAIFVTSTRTVSRKAS